MNTKLVTAGSALMILGMAGYFSAPDLMSHFMNSFTGTSGSSSMATNILQQMGIPPIDTMDQMIHYSFACSAVAGVIIILFGIAKKKFKRQFSSTDTESKLTEKEYHIDPTQKSIQILKERLAKGEITQNDFKNLKKLLE